MQGQWDPVGLQHRRPVAAAHAQVPGLVPGWGLGASGAPCSGLLPHGKQSAGRPLRLFGARVAKAGAAIGHSQAAAADGAGGGAAQQERPALGGQGVLGVLREQQGGEVVHARLQQRGRRQAALARHMRMHISRLFITRPMAFACRAASCCRRLARQTLTTRCMDGSVQ